MRGFITSLNPLFSRYKSEIILLSFALIILTVSGVLFFQQKNAQAQTPLVKEKYETRTPAQKQTITVDVSGAVKMPFVYTLSENARFIDAIMQAGGLTDEADSAFVKRNINLARILSDQEKIYIPFLSDTASGSVLENKRIIDYTQPNSSTPQTTTSSQARININVASTIELDQLPGVGPVIAEAIIAGRPYTSVDDLIKNSVIKQSVYDKIKDLVSVY